MVKRDEIHRRHYNHMQSIKDDVREVCPDTGRYIEPKEIPIKLVVNHYLLSRTSTLPHPLDKYKAMGVKNMTDKQIESAYNMIKGLTGCRILD